MRFNPIRFAVAASMAGVLSLSAATFAVGPDWVEVGDAGSDYNTAQAPRRPQGAVFLGSIAGRLTSGVGVTDYEDLYFISVTDPAGFTISPATADFNAVLYIFNITVNREVFGLLGNDDSSEESSLPRLVSEATDGTGARISQPGDYLIAITGAGRVPVSRSGRMFDFGTPTEVSGADGQGGLNPLEGWEGQGEQGNYRFVIIEGDFPTVPTPAGVTLLGGALLAFTRRRR